MKPVEHAIVLKQREWQRPLVRHFRDNRKSGTPSHASVVAHRRAGKDRVALFIEAEIMLAGRPVEVWHSLPEYGQARKVIWQSITRDGKRLIDEAFPPAFVRSRNEHEMTITLHNGSLWRAVGADNFNSLVGSNPTHVTFSEFALTNPKSRDFVRPILAENGGSELMITTPRGYNHAYELHEYAAKSDQWYAATHPVSQTRLIPADVLAEERASMPDELYRQEYECSFSAANVGAILGSRIEDAEKAGRISDDVAFDVNQPVLCASDIGFRDTTAWWFWQPRPDGVAIIDYIEDNGMDADDWIDRLRTLAYDLSTVWLPHDAVAKTFATKRSPMERFMAAGFKVRITPRTSVDHRINAARMLLPKAHFAESACAEGLRHLRSWAYKFDDVRRVFSREPDHDLHSHGGDAFSYAALVANEARKPEDKRIMLEPARLNLDTLWQDRDAETRTWI